MEIWIVAYVVLMIGIAVMDGVLSVKSFQKNKTTGRYLGFACMWATIIDISYLCSILSKSYGFVSVMSSIYFMGIDGVLISLFIFTTYFTKGAFSGLEKVLTRICCSMLCLILGFLRPIRSATSRLITFEGIR